MRKKALILVSLFLGIALLSACGSNSKSTGSTDTEAPVATEDNPPGDIPDDQALVPYHSTAGGYTLDTPEGWARKEAGSNVTFVDKLHTIAVDVSDQTTSPSVDSVNADEIPALTSGVEAFEKVSVEAVNLPSGPAILVRYRENSAPDAVTGKRVRLETDQYEYYEGGKLAIVSLSAPAGSDNVDVWRQISRSFSWDG